MNESMNRFFIVASADIAAAAATVAVVFVSLSIQIY